ncbi:hypothetical protein PF005_g24784 [Phytophthora fragariae]|uniref:Uncharacterized protein n=1 Tax=Phytophthora fragariae TaxID=53985 RepID=A0A6A3WSR5_9STRA|nr:hypothetical protein PF003_g12337 [Phytophthora fragariae]KAE8924204.1 hypothetical protein PF009_g25560 [Phytophthora fragariae]KAE8977773.1 hypothetical protein PF011_g23515 [Phytophthora fragariae]KAE9075546.1 hypothetical protein PF010_g24258 [Phytophthora fragariae]KAE9076015.1 hypothetical protein PF007_g24784 [Phytophthora fragariae]
MVRRRAVCKMAIADLLSQICCPASCDAASPAIRAWHSQRVDVKSSGWTFSFPILWAAIV